MTNSKTRHGCFCTFVPPQVLDSLSRQGVSTARASSQQSTEFRRARINQLISRDAIITSAAPAVTTQPGLRKVYDSGNTWAQRVALVREESDPATADDDVTNAYEFAGKVRDYFMEFLNRNSIDNNGMDFILNVHYGVDYMNAFWDGDEMTFGDGDGTIFTSFARSLDVVAHELAHGVTQFTADLDYYSQSGALNEHFSDVFGTAVTQFAEQQDAGTADWLIGDEIMGPELYGEALRSMKAPGTAYDNALLGKDPQPDHMDSYYSGPADNRGVHINSGIPNRAFYLTASDMGTHTATKIWYHALQRLWSTANFNDAVKVIVESARILVKAEEAPLGATQTVRSAFKEVGLPA